ncbi:DUF4973 domain-containing protein [Paraflavitalea sp. CAU 1676]|uniref:DUF4973 domain-containing protein n=1 Tax=Paraflavitalea sp. CAU 1676 TaxID=3032598 RepID=UPI0023DB987D|nr:DUF4973 domain-containing protein [Paraflavitalea sp. CAU 1676]MDF2191876.1 DUF4973 domain-containing protein [Paraflavitalea sp. CAU 1676]
MKKIHLYILSSLLLGLSCKKEWTQELYVQEVSMVKSGVVTVYAKYQRAGGGVTVKVPVVVSGSNDNRNNIDVTIEIDKDTLQNLNFDRFRLRQDLYFQQLDAANYTFRSMTTTIPSGSLQGYYDLDLKLEGLDLINKYILPVKIASTSNNNVSKRKWFSKSLMQIIPFNDYSGRYSNAGLIWNRDVPQNNQTALSTPYRNAWVVNENTVFFFAGNIDEEAFDRKKYKIVAALNADSTVTLTAPDDVIRFSQQKGTYTISKRKDEVQPYLEKTYITMNLEYWYSDITNPAFPINYRFVGPLTLEKVRNTQIPDEDQQVRIE